MTERRSAYFTISRNTVWVAKMDGWLPPGEYPGYSEYTVTQPDGDERRLRVKAGIVLDDRSIQALGYPPQMVGVELNVMASLMTGSATAREDDSS
jgi:hypothetical protein